MAPLSSSLAGWDGRPIPPQLVRIPPITPQPLRLNPPSWLSEPHYMLPSPESATLTYEPVPASPEFDAPLTPLAADFQWQYEPSVQNGAFYSSADNEFDGGLEDYAREAATPQEYELELQGHVRAADDAHYALFDELRYYNNN